VRRGGGRKAQKALLAKHSDLRSKLPPLGEAFKNDFRLSYTQWEAWLPHQVPNEHAENAGTRRFCAERVALTQGAVPPEFSEQVG
jgi:hypothetical protein